MLKLVPPGKRKNKFWAVRGSLEGNKIEQSLGVSLRQDAEKKLKQLIIEYEKGKGLEGSLSFGEAIERYKAFRNPSHHTTLYLNKIEDEIGDKLLTEINFHTLVAVANKMHPKSTAQTKNRAVLTPCAAVMHYAARNNWCNWLRVEKFETPSPETRFVDDKVEQKLLDNTEGKQYLFILWLFSQGDRVSDVLGIKYEDCNTKKQTVSRYISKSDRHVVLPLDEKICKTLTRDGDKTGLLFPWRDKWAVYRWLRPLCERLKVEFTPHRARHTLGKRLNDTGAGLKTIMQILGQSDPKSAIRYQSTDIEALRNAKKKAA